MKYLKIGLIALALIGLEYLDTSAAPMPSTATVAQHRRNHHLHHYRHHYVHHHRVSVHLPGPPPPPPAPPHP